MSIKVRHRVRRMIAHVRHVGRTKYLKPGHKHRRGRHKRRPGDVLSSGFLARHAAAAF